MEQGGKRIKREEERGMNSQGIRTQRAVGRDEGRRKGAHGKTERR